MSDATKTVKIVVPSEFLLPPFYTDAAPSKRALALKLGAEAAAILQKRVVDSLRQETHEEAVKQATLEFEAQLAQQAEESQAIVQKARAQAQRAEEALRAAQLRLEALEMGATEIRSQAQKETRSALTELLAAKDAQIQRLQTTLDKQMDAMSSKMEHLQHALTKTGASSKEKGTMGEAFMEGLLKRAFDCDIQVVSKEAQTADIRMHRPAASYLWEVKNYTRMVSEEEIQKFKRDMRLHPTMRGGVLVSLRMGIVGKTRGGDIDLEFLEDGRFILYLSNFMAHEDAVFFLQNLRPLFETVERLTRPAQAEEETIRALEAKAALITNLLRSHEKIVASHKNSLVGHRKRMDLMFAEFQGFLLEEEAQLQTLLRVALGGQEATAEVAAEADTVLSSVVFRKERLSDCGDEKVRGFLKWLLVQAEVREGTQIEIRELMDRLRGSAWSEKWVKGVREELFQEAAWAKGARHILGLRWLVPAAAQQQPAAVNLTVSAC
jgi:hypothetical protein